MNVHIDEKTAQALSAQAEARGLSLEAYLRFLAASGPTNGALTLPEFERALDELASGLPKLLTLADDFRRADVYSDHD